MSFASFPQDLDPAARPMGGWESAARYVKDYLDTALDVSVLNMAELQILDYEPPALDAGNLPTDPELPFSGLIYVSCMDTVKIMEKEIDMATRKPTYNTTYLINVMTWVKGPGWRETRSARNTLLNAVRLAIFNSPGLLEPQSLFCDVNTWREKGNMPDPIRGDRHIAGGQTTFQMQVTERLIPPPIAPVGDVIDTANLLADTLLGFVNDPPTND